MTQRTEGQTSANEPTDSVHFKPVPYFPVNRSYTSPPCQVWTLPSASRNRETIGGVIFVGDRQFGLSVLPIFDAGPGRGNAAPTDKPTSGEGPVQVPEIAIEGPDMVGPIPPEDIDLPSSSEVLKNDSRGSGQAASPPRFFQPRAFYDKTYLRSEMLADERNKKNLQDVDPIGYLSSDIQKGKKNSGWALIDLLDRAKSVNRFEVSSKEGGIDVIVVDNVAKQPIVNDSKIKILTGRYENQSRLTTVVEGTGRHLADDLPFPRFNCMVAASALNADDDGSWVVDADSNKLLGILYGVSEGDRPTCRYIGDIFDNIEKRLGSRVRLPKRPSESITEDYFGKGKGKIGSDGLEEETYGVRHHESELKLPQPHLDYDETRIFSRLFHGGRQPFRAFPENESNFGDPLPTIDKWYLWELAGEARRTWENEVRPNVKAVIRRSLQTSRPAATPILSLHGLMVSTRNTKTGPATRTVMIACDSREYRNRLRKSVRRSGVLEMRFEVMSVNMPIRLC
ncbi:hypothetical protein F5882DRAFT_422372 [Hyaloscypha sp. PMI_1271]|nr:hypothetical protein F5882DRAFT_422372 [Hyaloscypha sp. PMI_1271]